FFFQAEDGIRDPLVTGVQTCALPISDLLRDESAQKGFRRRQRATSGARRAAWHHRLGFHGRRDRRDRGRPGGGRRADEGRGPGQIGRASCRERGEVGGGEGEVRGRKG